MRTSLPSHTGATARCAAALAAIAALLAIALATAPAARAATAVTVLPSPGDRVATRTTQIVIRGIPTSAFGTITVTGSQSGVHTGTIEGDTDDDGGSFIPSTPFTAGETVTVQTALDVTGGSDGRWSFTVETPASPPHVRDLKPESKATKGEVWTYRTQPSLKPPAIDVTAHRKGVAPGDLFFGPQFGPDQNGIEVVNPSGTLVYFKPVPHGDLATDVDVQTYNGQPALTWWQGLVTVGGTGRGVDEIENSSYRHVASVRAGNGLQADLHEFTLGAGNTAWITAYRPVIWNASKIKGGSKTEIVLDSIAQEIDIKTGLVLFQWDSLDHVALGASYSPVAKAGVPWDYFHINAIQPLSNGTLLISSRNTSAVYDVSEATGRIGWSVGGKFSTYKLGPGARFWFQHDAQLQANGQLTMFDDAGAPYHESQSRGLTLNLDASTKTATVATQFTHSPKLKAPAEGGDQTLSNGDTLLGWGQGPDLATEYNAKHQVRFDAKFVGPNASYRVFRVPWTGTPSGRPAVAARVYHGQVSVSASWNGTTVTHRWRILGGSSAKKLSVIGDYRKTYFQTTMRTHRSPRYVEVQSVDAAGKVLGSSKVVKVVKVG
jgi:hypothetical protein